MYKKLFQTIVELHKIEVATLSQHLIEKFGNCEVLSNSATAHHFAESHNVFDKLTEGSALKNIGIDNSASVYDFNFLDDFPTPQTILLSKPTAAHNHYTLVSCSIGRINSLESADVQKEAVFCLPPDWKCQLPVDQMDAADLWPFDVMSLIAFAKTQLSLKQVVPLSDDVKKSYPQLAPFSCVLVHKVALFDESFTSISDKEIDVDLLGLYPLYESEHAFMKKNGVDALVKLLNQANVSVLFDRNRKPVV